MIPYIHYKQNKNHLINFYFKALLPLIIFSIYKNGIVLFTNDLAKFWDILIPVYFFAISMFVGLGVALILKENIKENILIALILCSTISINTNLLIYPIVLFIGMIISNVLAMKYQFNKLALMRVILILALLFNTYSYANVSEKLNYFNYNYFDKFLGFSTNGLATSSIALIIIALIILLFNKFYKKEIAISASLVYFLGMLCCLALGFVSFDSLFNGAIYFTFIFIASDIYVAPVSKIGQIVYGGLIGFLTLIITNLVDFVDIVYIIILLVSLLIPFINKLVNKYLHI